MVTIVSMDNEENFLQFLDPDLCDIVETHSKGGLRTIQFEYKFQDLYEDKELFKLGNKIWVQNGHNIRDCLYVINTSVKEDIYRENSFTMECEEVLVELNYAPVFSQNELTTNNGFKINNTNDAVEVTVNWNALNYWFGRYFNIGVVQDCLSPYAAKISLNGTINLMNLLRKIEEETGNVFVTRYEKDCLNNTIHRYLDFLNPINISKNWELNLEYDFLENAITSAVYDENDNIISEDPYEDVYEADDIVVFEEEPPVYNIDPTTTLFRITDGLQLLNSDGQIYDDGGDETPLSWSSEDIGLEDTDSSIVIQLVKSKNYIALTIKEKTIALVDDPTICGDVGVPGFISIESSLTPDEKKDNAIIPDDAYFEIVDTERDLVVFQTCINRTIGHVHEEVLDFGFNLENIELEIDESETFQAISPILSLDEGDKSLSRTDMGKIISSWKSLAVSKGVAIPMVVEKINVTASSLANAKSALGTFNVSSNYWKRPLHPADNIDSSTPANSTWEFWRATAYWRAPYTKYNGDLHVTTNKILATEYTSIRGRPDSRDSRAVYNHAKMGNIETDEEDIYNIFTAVCQELKNKEAPVVNLEVDVANLQGYDYNNYDLHDKIYIKLPDTQELVTARIVGTHKEMRDISKNTIEVSNYNITTVKTLQNNTFIEASNMSLKYPKKGKLTVRLVNEDYDSLDDYSVQYPANKLVTFHLFKVENGNSTSLKNVYNRITNAQGQASLDINLSPGDYEVEISFGGDEEYTECSSLVEVNISGTVEKATATKKTTNTTNNKKSSTKDKKLKAKITKKTGTKAKKQKKTYYTKYGVSPDGKYLMAIGRPSAGGELNKYGYKFYKVVFVRKCPFCGSKELYWNIFWTGNENGSWGNNPAVGRRKSGSAEGEITCKKCDADFSIFGKDKAVTARKNLKVYKKAVKVNKSEAYTLKKGKMVYNSEKVTVKAKKNTSTKTRTIKDSSINAKVKQKALNIVGDSTGVAAAKKIAAFMGKNISYDYYANFQRSPKNVLARGKGNCCDQTRLMLQLMDAAGCTEALTLQFVHVCCNQSAKYRGIGHVFARVINKKTGNYTYVDPCKKSPWGNYVHGWGNPPGNRSNYPTTPF